MYRPGDLLVYGYHGVCRVCTLENMEIDGKSKPFLMLEPIYLQGAKLMIPSDNAAAMDKITALLPPEEIQQILASESVRNGQWEMQDTLRKRKQKDLLCGKDRRALITEICTCYRRKKDLTAIGRRLRQSDENFLSDAEKRICGEIAAAMRIPMEEAFRYLREALQ